MERVDIAPAEWLDQPNLVRETHQRLTREGILMAVADADGKLNPMTIGWGVFGCIWGRDIFVTMVRPSRYTYECIEHTGDYTVNVLPAALQDAAASCGTVSGRDQDKLAINGLTPVPSQHIRSAGIAEASIVFECKVVHHNDLAPDTLPHEITAQYYPLPDHHRIYYGQILRVSASTELVGP